MSEFATDTLHEHRELDDMLGRRWRKPQFIKRDWLRWLFGVGFVVYLIAAFLTIEVDWARVYIGLDRGWAFVRASPRLILPAVTATSAKA